MADEFMYLPNDVTQNYLSCMLKCLDNQLNEPTNHNSFKVFKLGKQTLKLKF